MNSIHLGYLRFLLIVLLSTVALNSGCATLYWERHAKLSCGTCHEGGPTEEHPALKNKKNPSDICKKCHRYGTDGDHHPSDPDSQPVTGKTSVLDPGFPLVNGKMECLTCHQMHSEKEHYSGSQYFLRGGPYSGRRDICFKCHKKDSLGGLNPHEQMIGENKDLNRFICLVCHLVTPDPKVDTFKTVKFRASVAFLCWRCHPPMPQEFMDKHFLKKPKDGTYQEMIRGEVKHRIIMPLDSKGRVTCSTCHNPHQPGVMVREWAKKGEGARKRLRVSGEEICTACHSGKIQ